MDFNETPAEQACTPLLNTSRDLRIAAAKQIPDLLKAIEEKVKKKIELLAKVSDTEEPLAFNINLQNDKPKR